MQYTVIAGQCNGDAGFLVKGMMKLFNRASPALPIALVWPIALFALAAALFFSCSKKGGNPLSGAGPGIYVTGSDGANPMLWSSSGTQQLAGNGGFGSQVVLAGGNVYVAGVTNDHPSRVQSPGGPGGQYTYWKNGAASVFTPLVLINNPTITMAVSGNDVYFSNWTLFKNGTAYLLPGAGAVGSVSAATTVGTDVYFAGHDSAGDGVYWKNGGMHVIDQVSLAGSEVQITSICVSDTDVYVGGADGLQRAAIWKNGVKTVIPSTNGGGLYRVRSIFVQGQDIYWISDQGSASYWKNGVVTNLSPAGATGNANCIFVAGNDVYVAGSSSDHAALWKNGVPTILSSGGEANSVVVMQ